jgi:hypothetical protein
MSGYDLVQDLAIVLVIAGIVGFLFQRIGLSNIVIEFGDRTYVLNLKCYRCPDLTHLSPLVSPTSHLLLIIGLACQATALFQLLAIGYLICAR